MLCGVVTTIEGTQKNKNNLPYVSILRFYSPKNKQDVLSWATAINREKFKVEVYYLNRLNSSVVQLEMSTVSAQVLSNFAVSSHVPPLNSKRKVMAEKPVGVQ